MSFQELIIAAKKYFPDLRIKYKDQSPLMWLMSKLLVFNRGFMTRHTTTINNFIYFPSEKFVKCHPISASVVLLHELVHLYDRRRVGKLFFSISYLFPQVLLPICSILFIFISWKIILPITLLCMLPIPAIFRMHWEKRAYLSSFYVLHKLGIKMGFDPHLKNQENIFLNCFHGLWYYGMWPFHDIDKLFDDARRAADADQRPFQDPIFDILDDLVSKI